MAADPPPMTGGARTAPASSPALRLQILSTEHWSLLASRSLAWNESFSRAAMFLSTISGAIVALALVAQASHFGSGFRLFALVILPVVLLVGIGTVLRIGASNYHDAMCVAGMNRIRGGYLELEPDLERFFVMGTHDDREGMMVTMAVAPSQSFLVHTLAATPMLIAALNSMLVAAIVSLLTKQLGASNLVAAGVGALGFIGSIAAHAVYSRRAIAQSYANYEPLFPSPPGIADQPG